MLVEIRRYEIEPGRLAEFVEFFDRQVPVSKAVALLGSRTGAHVVTTYCIADESGHYRLYALQQMANVNLYASSGLADGKGSFSYILYIRPEEYERAASALEL